MNTKSFRLVIFLFLTIFAVLGLSGCGGSGSGSLSNFDMNENDPVVLNKIYDFDEDGLPDTLDFDDLSEVYYDKDELIYGREITVPSRHYLKRLSAFNSPDSFIADLTAGIEYTVEISKGDFYQYEIGANIPDVKIFNPNGRALSFDVDSASEFLSPDIIEHSVYPPDEPYVICLTFTPSVTGRYKITLSNWDSSNIYDDVTLFVYKELRNEETGEAGYYKRFKFYDKEGNASATVSMNDIAALRKAFNKAEFSVIEEQIISGDYESMLETKTTPQVEAYLDCIRRIKQHYGIFDDYIEDELYRETNNNYDSESESQVTAAADSSSGGTKVPAELYGIAYDWPTHRPGTGFFAVTGNKANQSRSPAIEDFQLPVPKNPGVKTLYQASLVSSQQDAENISATTMDGKVQLGGFGFQAGRYDPDSFKFGLTSTTLVIHYEKTETDYRKLANDSYELDEDARDVLQNFGAEAFRNEYGDYFVAGYQYGATYDAFVTISTNTPEQLVKVKNYLLETFKKQDNAGNADVGRKTQEFLKKNEAEMKITLKAYGVDINFAELIAEGANDISLIAKSLSLFIEKSNNISAKQRQPVYVMLKRYSLLTEVFAKMLKDKYSRLIPIPSKQATKIMNVRQDMITTNSYMSVIRDANEKVMPKSVKHHFEEQFNSIRSYINTNNDVFTNVNKLRTLRKNVNNVNKVLKDIGDRYVFYRLLMKAQEQERRLAQNPIVDRPYGPQGGSIGYDSFMSSAAIQRDINKGTEHIILYENNFYLFQRTREASFNFSENSAICHIDVSAINIYDTRRDITCPAIGTHRIGYVFQCGEARWMQWKITLRTMNFDKDTYPFTGLTR